MNEKIKNILLIITAVAAVVSLFKGSCATDSEKTFTSDTLVVYLKDTNTHSKTHTNLQPINNFYYNKETHVDTGAVLRDYFTKYFFKTTNGDSLIKITVEDTVYKNGIPFQKVSWKFLKPYEKIKTITNTTTETKTIYPFGFYAGATASFDYLNKKLPSAGLELDFVTRHAAFGLGLDLLNKDYSGDQKLFGNKNIEITGKVLFKLGK